MDDDESELGLREFEEDLDDGKPPRREKLPSRRQWEKSEILTPQMSGLIPELISDAAGLPFTPEALAREFEPLDPTDPAVVVLAARIAASRSKTPALKRLRRGSSAPPEPVSLDGWRELARTEEQVLFAHGRPPRLLTVAMDLQKRHGWVVMGVSPQRSIRAARDGIRASSFRLDPTQELAPTTTVLRILLTEQSYSGGMRASGRILTPEVHFGEEELVIRMYVKPPHGFQTRSPNPETPVRIELPEPLGIRVPVDGSLLWAPPPRPKKEKK